MAFELTSPVFRTGGRIPDRYTCKGEDLSPPLEWTDPPAGTRSLVLILEDPDAPRGVWAHWLLHDVPPDAAGLAEGCSGSDQLPEGSAEGKNDWGRIGYNGPCPPSGTHRYYFRLAALDTDVQVPRHATRDELLRAMAGHVLAEATLIGLYGR